MSEPFLGTGAAQGAIPLPFRLQAPDATLLIETPEEQWSYGWEVDASTSAHSGHLVVEIEANVLKGSVGVGILRRDRQKFFHEIALTANDGPQRIRVVTPRHDDNGGLVVRNRSTNGSSTVELSILGASPTRYDLYLAYQPGKVASQSIETTLRRLLPLPFVERHHYLSQDALRFAMNCAEVAKDNSSAHDYYWGVGGMVEQVQEAERALRRLSSIEPGRTLIITGIRDPVSYAIAAFFQNIDVYCPWLTYAPEHAADETARVMQYFMDLVVRAANRLPSVTDLDEVARQKLVHPGAWFENEFKLFTGIDIYSAPLNNEPFVLFEAGGWDVLLFRFEQLSTAFEDMLETVGLPPVALSSVNVGVEKAFGEIYREFRRQFQITNAVRTLLLDNDYTRRFYPHLA